MQQMSRWAPIFLVLGLTAQFPGTAEAETMGESTIHITVSELGRVGPLPCRMMLSVPGADETFRPEGAYDYRGAWLSPGESTVTIPIADGVPRELELQVTRGLETVPVIERIQAQPGVSQTVTIQIKRWVKMSDKGWWSGDLHVHRPVSVMRELLLAEDLNLAPVLTVWNKKNLWKDAPLPEKLTVEVDEEHAYHVLSLEDERGGGALMYNNLHSVPVDMTDDTTWWPAAVERCAPAREAGGWTEIEKPFWWEVPVWMALAEIDSMGIVCNHFTADRTWDDEVWGRHRNLEEQPGPLGFTHWICDIYYHFLNLGFRLPPTAGSASGVLPNEVGGNRTYVHLGSRFDYNEWWKELRAGRCFSTNGPILLAKADLQLPGSAIAPSLSTEVTVETTTRQGLRSIELVADGKVTERRDLEPRPGTMRHTFKVDTTETSWIAVRCFETETGNIRFAHIGPFYIEGRTRAAAHSEDADFFVQWMDELIAQDWNDPKRDLSDAQREALREIYGEARAFYVGLQSN